MPEKRLKHLQKNFMASGRWICESLVVNSLYFVIWNIWRTRCLRNWRNLTKIRRNFCNTSVRTKSIIRQRTKFLSIYKQNFHSDGARGGAVGWDTALQAGRSRVRFPMAFIGIFHWRNPSGRTMALGSTQPPGEYRRPVQRTDNLTNFMCRFSSNLRASTFLNPQDVSRPGTVYFHSDSCHIQWEGITG